MMSQVAGSKTQEEYEDDFEKDLDWLIDEEARSEEKDPDYEDIEAQIDKELKEEEEQEKARKKSKKEIKRGIKKEEVEEVEEDERWPSPMEPLEVETDRESPSKLSPTAPPPPVDEDETDDEKKYILEKIEQANRELQDQEAPDMSRRRRLQFKETLVDLVVPPLDFEQGGSPRVTVAVMQDKSMAGSGDTKKDNEVSGKLSELQISQGEGGREGGREEALLGISPDRTGPADDGQTGQGGKEGRVLVEKDGKFDFVSLKEVEGHNLLPPLNDNPCSPSRDPSLSVNKSLTSSPRPLASSLLSQGMENLWVPRPPAKPRNRPNSASHSQRGSLRRVTKRRVQSASGGSSQSTYTLSPQQKELLQRIQERKERLAREAEQRQREEEQQKREQNEQAFRAWLTRKKDQLQEERRIQRAQEMERMSGRKELSDPTEAYHLWLQRKQEQQMKERQLEEMRRLEQESGFYLHNKEECERAFKLWLKRKWMEKRAEQQAARERSRRLVVEERRARRMHDLRCTVEAKPFRFAEHLAYRF